jgi:hypothetical protein
MAGLQIVTKRSKWCMTRSALNQKGFLYYSCIAAGKRMTLGAQNLKIRSVASSDAAAVARS